MRIDLPPEVRLDLLRAADLNDWVNKGAVDSRKRASVFSEMAEKIKVLELTNCGRGKSIRCLARDVPSHSRVGASGKYGTVHS